MLTNWYLVFGPNIRDLWCDFFTEFIFFFDSGGTQLKSLGGKTEEVKTATVAAPTTPATSDNQTSLSEDEGNQNKNDVCIFIFAFYLIMHACILKIPPMAGFASFFYKVRGISSAVLSGIMVLRLIVCRHW